MGEIAEMMLDGTLCSCCGELLIDEGEEEAGFPMMCVSCEIEDKRQRYNQQHPNSGAKAIVRPVPGPHCDKTFAGDWSLRQHLRDKHGDHR